MSMSRREMELRIKELFDAESILIKRIHALESLLRECADDIEAYVEATYTGTRLKYGTEQAKYERDIEIVNRARALLAGPELEPEPQDQRGVAAELAKVFVGKSGPVTPIPAPPYPFCRTPLYCAGKGYCPKDPACNN